MCCFKMASLTTIGILSTIAVSLVLAYQPCEVTYRERDLQEELKSSLFCEYDTDDRQIKDQESTLTVQLGIDVKRIVTSEENDDQQDKVTIYGMTMLTWQDPYLNWSHIKKFGSIFTLFVPSYKLWVPNIVVTNSKYRQSTRELDAHCMLLQDGEVTCIAFTSYETYCKTDFRRWPYDSLNCTLKFTAFMKTGEALNLTMMPYYNNARPIKKEQNERHHYWKLQSTKATYGVPGLKALNVTFPFISYSFILVRQTATWATLIIGPVLVLITMTIISYILDVGSPERMGILATAIICHYFYLLQLCWYLPSSGNTCPLIVIFLRGSMILTIVAILQTIILMFLQGCTSNSVHTVLGLLEKITGKIFTFQGFYKMETAESDESNATRLKWVLLTVFLNRVLLTITIAAYLIMFVATITL